MALEASEECFLWTGAVTTSGYGAIKVAGKICVAHRVAYELHTGEELPSGAILHHTCRNRLCYNPGHLQVTDHSEHRKLHTSATCTKCGASDWYIRPNGWRVCRSCKRERERRRAA